MGNRCIVSYLAGRRHPFKRLSKVENQNSQYVILYRALIFSFRFTHKGCPLGINFRSFVYFHVHFFFFIFPFVSFPIMLNFDFFLFIPYPSIIALTYLSFGMDIKIETSNIFYKEKYTRQRNCLITPSW